MPIRLSVTELIVRLGLPATISGPTDVPVESVRIVDEVSDVSTAQAGCALILTGNATSESWRIERALRLGWERAVACVVITRADAQGPDAAELAERLKLALVTIDAGALDATVRIAAIIATDEASEAGTLAAAARGFGVASLSPKKAIGILRRLLPMHEFALVERGGSLIAGSDRAASAAKLVIKVDVPFPDTRAPAHLVGIHRPLVGGRGDYQTTAVTVARLAAAPLAAWAANRRIEAQHNASHARAILAQLVAVEGQAGAKLRAKLAALGWLHGARYRVAFVLPSRGRGAELDELLFERLAAVAAAAGAAPHGSGWVVFFNADDAGERQTIGEAAEMLADFDSRVGKLAVGISSIFYPAEPVTAAIEEALSAAQVGLASPDPVLFSEALTPASALPALLGSQPAAAVNALMAPLLAIDADGTLMATLLASLDYGDRTAQVATLLNVHRNTVTSRLDRVRAVGIDPANPTHRLAIHIAARRLSNIQTNP